MSLLRARWLGRMPYREAWDLQRAFHEGRASGRAAADYLLLLEHPPTYTIGTGGVTSPTTGRASWWATRSSTLGSSRMWSPTCAAWSRC